MYETTRKTLEAKASSEPFWRAPLEFVVHALVGTLIFAIIGGPAIILDVAVHATESYGMSVLVTYALKTAEYVLFVTDLILFVVFLWRTAARALRKL